MICFLNSNEPSDLVRRRAASMWARRIKNTGGKLTYRVCPYGAEFNHRAKSKRIVIVDLVHGTAECFDKSTGASCIANSEYVPGTGEAKRPRLCSHVFAVLIAIATNEKRKNRSRRAA